MSIIAMRGMGRLRGRRRRLGQIDSYYDAASTLDSSMPWYYDLIPGGPAIYQVDQVIPPPPGGYSLSNVTSGSLNPAQVAALQASGAQSVQDVDNNAVASYGVDSPAATAAASVLQSQESGVYSDIAALNPQASSSDPLLAATGVAWYWWALGAVGIFVLVERK